MSTKDKKAKERIVKATIELLSSETIEHLTMRRIAKEANVTLSSINYYYQSKENLIDVAIQSAFFSTTGTWDELYTNVNGDSLTKFKKLYKMGSKFIMAYPQLAKLSLLRDFSKPSITDNSSQLYFAYFEAFKDIYQDEKSDQELKLLIHMLISASQTAILRHEVLQEFTGFDMSKDQDRDFVLDFVFDTIVQKRRM